MPVVLRIDAMLVERRMKLTELSELIGMEYNRLSQMKLGNVIGIKLETIDKLCTALKCSPGDLFKQISEEEYETLYKKKNKNSPEL